jgi:spore maturation protein CgeB
VASSGCRTIDALCLDPARAAAMIEAGHARVLRDHTFSQRAKTILNDWLSV